MMHNSNLFKFWRQGILVLVLLLLCTPQLNAQLCFCSAAVRTILPTQVSNCQYDFVALTQVSLGCTGDSVVWDFGDGTTQTVLNGTQASHTYSGSGTFQVCLTLYYSSGSQSCSVTECIPLNVTGCASPCETCNLSLSNLTAQNAGTCNQIFSVNVTTNSESCSLVQLDWDFGDGTSQTGVFPQAFHTFPYDGTYNVCVTATALTNSGDTCTTQTCLPVTVIGCGSACEDCDLSLSNLTSQDLSVCSKAFNVNVSSASEICSVQNLVWDFGDGNSQSGTMSQVLHSYDFDGTYNVCVTATAVTTNGETCVAQICETITVSGCGEPCEQCNLGISALTVTDSSACTKVFEVSPAGGKSECTFLGYTWDLGDGTVVETASSLVMHTYTSTGPFTACVTLTSVTPQNDTCRVDSCIPVEAIPCVEDCESCAQVDSIGFFTYNACGHYFLVQPQIDPSCQILDYIWDLGDGTIDTVSTNSISHNFGSSGIFQICVTIRSLDPLGDTCGTTVCRDILVSGCQECSTDYLEPNDFPFTATDLGFGNINEQGLCIHPSDEDWFNINNGQWYARVLPANPAVSGTYNLFGFTFGNQTQDCIFIRTFSNASTNTYLELYDATFNLLAVDDNSGGDLQSLILYCTSEKAPALSNKTAEVYPTLVQAGCKLNVSHTLSGDVLVMVDLQGKVVLRQQVQQTGAQSLSLPTDLSTGLYILQSSQGHFAPTKIMIQVE